jgi:tetratricopeptide (TPR) repeat protein
MAKNYRLALKIEQKNEEAQHAEQNNHIDKAIQLYEQNIKEDYADEFAFERLMILYRKEKEYKEELRVIKRGIEVFKQSLKEHLKRSLSRHVDSRKLEQLSNAILKKTGSKKQDVHFPDPIDKWMKREEIVKQKLHK